MRPEKRGGGPGPGSSLRAGCGTEASSRLPPRCARARLARHLRRTWSQGCRRGQRQGPRR
jgi:hypothetical protein